MKIHNPIQKTTLAIAITSVLTLASAQDVALYETHVLPETLLFEPVSEQGLTSNIDVIIKGPQDFYLRKSFEPGTLVEINPVELAGGNLPDGNYKFETRIMGTAAGPAQRGQAQDGNSQLEFSNTSGTFSIKNGQIVTPETESDKTMSTNRVASSNTGTQAEDKQDTRDQTILDDLIVDGSICVGFDCVNGESFGFDTIRLKENNVRIKFDDTSTSASFPKNDWQLTANDSTNGGAEKFSIDDITGGRTPFTIEASAPSHSLYVDDGGRIGFGTSTPVVENHIVDGDTPTVRLEQDGSSGFTPQIWDLASNETNFFIRDATNGSQLPFRIRPGADSNSLYISESNDIGMGTASPSAQLHVSNAQSAGGTTIKLSETGNSAGAGSGANQDWELTIRNSDGGLGFNDPDPVNTGAEMYLTTEGNLFLKGTLTTATQTIPDYVFEDSYVLRPLEEVSSFIKEFGHLPGIPSAEDYAAKGGVNLSELQILLLEKVEELTLYTLQQQDTIKRLETKIEKLEILRD